MNFRKSHRLPQRNLKYLCKDRVFLPDLMVISFYEGSSVKNAGQQFVTRIKV
jgi:hypothetical protein